MTQTHSVSLGCPGCPKKSQHFFSPPNARADQRSARTRLASGDTSRALNNPSVVYKTGALDPAHTPHAFTAQPRCASVYIRTRCVHIIFHPNFHSNSLHSRDFHRKTRNFQKTHRTRFSTAARSFHHQNKVRPLASPILFLQFILSKTPRVLPVALTSDPQIQNSFPPSQFAQFAFDANHFARTATSTDRWPRAFSISPAKSLPRLPHRHLAFPSNVDFPCASICNGQLRSLHYVRRPSSQPPPQSLRPLQKTIGSMLDAPGPQSYIPRALRDPK